MYGWYPKLYLHLWTLTLEFSEEEQEGSVIFKQFNKMSSNHTTKMNCDELRVDSTENSVKKDQVYFKVEK